MITMDQARTLQGKKLLGQGGESLGTINVLYADREDGEPTFATVHTGLFGSRTSFVPLDQATVQGDDVVVPYSKDQVKGAPHIEADSELSPEEEQQLYAHYGLSGGSSYGTQTGTMTGTTGYTESDSGVVNSGTEGVNTGYAGESVTSGRGPVGHDTSGPTTDEAMTRSEERLTVGTRQAEVGRARLRKYIVTENVTQTVPVSHEEVRIEREPITDANRGEALSGPDLSEEEHEVVLHAEQAVVNKETVPVERVRLDTQTVTEQQQVSEQVRKEQIETEGGNVYPENDATTTRERDITNR